MLHASVNQGLSWFFEKLANHFRRNAVDDFCLDTPIGQPAHGPARMASRGLAVANTVTADGCPNKFSLAGYPGRACSLSAANIPLAR
jgi:hypothetical protein